MKVLKLFNIFLISITIITSGCSGLEYGNSVNSIETKYDTIEKYEERGSVMGPTLLNFPTGREADAYNSGLLFYYVILPITLAVLLIGTGVTIIVYNN